MAQAPHLTVEAADLRPPTPWAAAALRAGELLKPAVAIPAAGLVVAEIVVLLAGIVARYVFHSPSSGRTSSPASCSCGSPCWARSSPCSATSTCG